MLDALRNFLRTVVGITVLVVMTLILAPSAVVVARRNPTSPLIERIARLWASSILRAGGLDYEVEGREHFDPGRSYVVASNHLSNLDPMLHFLAVPAPVRFLAKKELFGIPVFGSALRAIGIVETDRRGGRGVHETINRQVEEALLARGRTLVIYPEGTRSRDGELKRPFKKGAFYIAIRLGMPVVPCAISGTWEAWRPGEKLIRGGYARVRFFSPIPTEGMTLADVDRLRAEVEETIADAFQELRA